MFFINLKNFFGGLCFNENDAITLDPIDPEQKLSIVIDGREWCYNSKSLWGGYDAEDGIQWVPGYLFSANWKFPTAENPRMHIKSYETHTPFTFQQLYHLTSQLKPANILQDHIRLQIPHNATQDQVFQQMRDAVRAEHWIVTHEFRVLQSLAYDFYAFRNEGTRFRILRRILLPKYFDECISYETLDRLVGNHGIHLFRLGVEEYFDIDNTNTKGYLYFFTDRAVLDID